MEASAACMVVRAPRRGCGPRLSGADGQIGEARAAAHWLRGPNHSLQSASMMSPAAEISPEGKKSPIPIV